MSEEFHPHPHTDDAAHIYLMRRMDTIADRLGNMANAIATISASQKNMDLVIERHMNKEEPLLKMIQPYFDGLSAEERIALYGLFKDKATKKIKRKQRIDKIKEEVKTNIAARIIGAVLIGSVTFILTNVDRVGMWVMKLWQMFKSQSH